LQKMEHSILGFDDVGIRALRGRRGAAPYKRMRIATASVRTGVAMTDGKSVLRRETEGPTSVCPGGSHLLPGRRLGRMKFLRGVSGCGLEKRIAYGGVMGYNEENCKERWL